MRTADARRGRGRRRYPTERANTAETGCQQANTRDLAGDPARLATWAPRSGLTYTGSVPPPGAVGDRPRVRLFALTVDHGGHSALRDERLPIPGGGFRG